MGASATTSGANNKNKLFFFGLEYEETTVQCITKNNGHKLSFKNNLVSNKNCDPYWLLILPTQLMETATRPITRGTVASGNALFKLLLTVLDSVQYTWW